MTPLRDVMVTFPGAQILDVTGPTPPSPSDQPAHSCPCWRNRVNRLTVHYDTLKPVARRAVAPRRPVQPGMPVPGRATAVRRPVLSAATSRRARGPSKAVARRVIAWLAPFGTITGVPTVRITQDDAADELLGRDPPALLLGMLLDQHVRRRSSRAPARAPLGLQVIESGAGSTARSVRRST